MKKKACDSKLVQNNAPAFPPAGLGMVTEDFTIIWLDALRARMAGVDQVQGLGKPWFEAVPQEGCRPEACPWPSIFKEAAPSKAPGEEVNRAGARLPCLVVASPSRGGPKELAGVINNLWEVMGGQVQEEAPRLSEELSRWGFQNAGTAMVVLEEDTTISLANRQFENLSGYLRAELEGKKRLSDFFGEKDLKRLEESCRLPRLKPDATPWDLEAGFIDKQGNLKELYFTGAGISGALRSVVSLWDLTPRRPQELSLQNRESFYRLLTENLTEVIWTLDLNTRRFTYLSPAIASLRGFSVQEGLAQTLEEVLAPASLELFRRRLEEELEQARLKPEGQPQSFSLELEVWHRRGGTIWTNSRMSFLKGPQGWPGTLLGVTRDLGEQKRIQDELRQSEARFRAIFAKGAVAMVLWDREGRIVECNEAFQEMVGYCGEELRGMALAGLSHADDATQDRAFFKELMSGSRDSYEMEQRYLHRDGRVIWGRLVASLVRDTAGQPRCAVGMVLDTTARRQAERFSHDLFFTSPIGVYLIQNQKFVLVNQVFQEITGYDQTELVGKESLWLVLPQDKKLVKQEAVKMLKGQRSQPFEYRVRTKHGATKWFMESVISTSYQNRPATLGFFMDISRRQQAEEALQEWIKKYHKKVEKLQESEAQLKNMSILDGLTGLLNHREFYRRLREELNRSRRYRRPFCLLMLDLDHFKDINDTYGHLVGDETLCSVAALIQEEVRVVDQVARYGGEEFAVILPETFYAGGVYIAERICHTIDTQKIACGNGASVKVTVSIGIAVYPDDGRAEEALVAAADEALYMAKRTGRNRVVRADRCGLKPGGELPPERHPDQD